MIENSMLDKRSNKVSSNHLTRDALKTKRTSKVTKSCLILEGLDKIQAIGTDPIIGHRTVPAHFQNRIEGLHIVYYRAHVKKSPGIPK